MQFHTWEFTKGFPSVLTIKNTKDLLIVGRGLNIRGHSSPHLLIL